ncbi:MAG: GAF domain-containing protein [Candidatus Heimdallarchaeota archaeon]|nr:GAF domain-containing protein [Candidatus Heimdallarchaeota archaeon]
MIFLGAELQEIAIDKSFLVRWQKILDHLGQYFNVPSALIMRVHPEEIEVFLKSQNKDNPYAIGHKEPLAGLYCTYVMEHNTELYVANALESDVWNNNPDIAVNMISYLGLPLSWPTGQIFGTVCVLDQAPVNIGQTYKNMLFIIQQLINSQLKMIYNLHLDNEKENDQFYRQCSYCKRIKFEKTWVNVDQLFLRSLNMNISHVICSKCFEKVCSTLDD